MRITGTLTSIGDHYLADGPNNLDTYELDVTAAKGVFITATADILRAAIPLLNATVDIYPHPVDGLRPGECTPENYAHALARLAHTEDHLAREVRSSQALLERSAALERTFVNMQGTINELVRQNDALRQSASDAAMEAQGRVAEWEVSFKLDAAKRTIATLTAKQAEQERLMTGYRVKYHEADRALRQAQADIEAMAPRLSQLRQAAHKHGMSWEEIAAAIAPRDDEEDDERGRDEEGNALA